MYTEIVAKEGKTHINHHYGSPNLLNKIKITIVMIIIYLFLKIFFQSRT